jgi:hypothetical protein
MLEAWYTKMRAGNFRSALDEVQLASHDQFDERAGQYGKSHILADVADVEKAVAELKLRPGHARRSMSPRATATPRSAWPKGLPGHGLRYFAPPCWSRRRSLPPKRA